MAVAMSLSLGVGGGVCADEPGDPERVRAVARGLEYLRKTQHQDGSWKSFGRHRRAALAVRAFLSAGHRGSGALSGTITAGVKYVLSQQNDSGLIANSGGHQMYEHGIGTLMLAEVVGSCDAKLEPEVRKALEKAVPVILKAQRKEGAHRGGWRYTMIGTDADMSVTGWQIEALRAARRAGIADLDEPLERALDYVLRTRNPATGDFRYTLLYGRTTPGCTAVGIRALDRAGLQDGPELLKAGALVMGLPGTGQGPLPLALLFGFAPPSTEVRKAMANLARQPLREKEAFFFYLAYERSRAAAVIGGAFRDLERRNIDRLLLAQQEENGSWGTKDPFGPAYGTTMAVLALTSDKLPSPIADEEK